MAPDGPEYNEKLPTTKEGDADPSSTGAVSTVPPTPPCRPLHEKELHIAPMLNVSKREFRKLFSILSTKIVLWTDMIVDSTIEYSDKLDDVVEGDMDVPNLQVCQIGGNSPDMCGRATRIVVQDYGYHEVNLNIDCPSDKVSLEREFGAVLMKKADKAFAVVEAMQQHVPEGTPISVKCRVGVDECDNLEFIESFVERLRPVCKNFYLHARKCVLTGLMNPRQNRSIPPLNFPRVYEICRRFPDCDFWINGGIRTLDHAKAVCYGNREEEPPNVCHEVPCKCCQYPNGSCTAPPSPEPPSNLRGCMLGRAAMDNPAIFADADRYFYGLPTNPCRNRRQVFEKYCQYLEEMYPRRCCDDDERITYAIPVPDVRLKEGEYCPICRPVYIKEAKEDEDRGSNENDPSEEPNSKRIEDGKAKIAPRIIWRSLIPIRGMFFGLPKSKQFNHRLDVLTRDATYRECGPGFIIRKALEDIIPPDVLDQDFVTSEEYSHRRFS